MKQKKECPNCKKLIHPKGFTAHSKACKPKIERQEEPQQSNSSFSELDQIAQELQIEENNHILQKTTSENHPAVENTPTSPEQSSGFTVEMAGNLIKMPFGLWAKMSGVKELGLSKDEIAELATPFKALLDEYAPAWLEKHGDGLIFAWSLTTIASAKVNIYVEHKKKQREEMKKNNDSRNPNTAPTA